MLSVFRDGTLHGQAELTVHGLRIGRGSENDIVLEDAAKRVSRLHAELRLGDDGVVLLTDLQSANGTWIAGDRVDSEAIEPGVPFTIGPYRLMLEDLADAGAVDYPDSLPAADPSLAAPADSVAQAPPPPSGVRRKGDTTKTQNWKSAAGVMDLALRHRWAALIGGAAVVSLAGLGIYAISTPDASSATTIHTDPPTPPPDTTPAPPPPVPFAAELDAANRLLVQGDKATAETALRDYILPILQKDPTNAAALDLKVVAERIITPVAPTATSPGNPPPVRVTVTPPDPKLALHQRLGEARAAGEKGDYRSALAIIDSLIADAPDFAEAAPVRARILSDRLEAAKRQLGEAEEQAKAGRLPEAIDALRRADGLDPSINVGQRVAELRARMQQEGEQAFIDGFNYSMAQRLDQAVPLLQKAYRYLPEGHKDKAAARTELERLRVPLR